MTEAIKQWIEDEAVAYADYKPDDQEHFSAGLRKGIEVAEGFAEWVDDKGYYNTFDEGGRRMWATYNSGEESLTTSQLLEKYLQTIK